MTRFPALAVIVQTAIVLAVDLLTASPGVGQEAGQTVTAKAKATKSKPARHAEGEDWPGFLGPTADGKSTEKIRLDWPAEGPPILWFVKLGEGYSAPSIVGDQVFVFDRVDDEARLAALRATDGELLWRVSDPTAYEDYYGYSGGPRASPVIDGGRVFTLGVDGFLRARSITDGALLWQVDTATRFGVVQNFFGVGASPVIEGELLIVQIGGSPPGSPRVHSGEVKGNGSGIVAFEKATGKVRYQLTDELASYSTIRLASIAGRRWGFAFTRGGLVGFEPTKGTEDFFLPWRSKKLESVNAAMPVVAGDKVLVTESYGPGSVLLRVKPGGYDIVWQDPPRGKSLESHWATPIHHQGYLYGSSGQSTAEAELRAIELKTGKVAWSEPELGRSTLLYADGHFLVLTEHGKLLLLEANPKSFVKKAELDLGVNGAKATAKSYDQVNDDAKVAMGVNANRPVLRFPSWNAPVLAYGRLYLRGKDQLVVLDIAP